MNEPVEIRVIVDQETRDFIARLASERGSGRPNFAEFAGEILTKAVNVKK